MEEALTHIRLQLITKLSKFVLPQSSATPGCLDMRVQLQEAGDGDAVLHRACDTRL